MKEPPWPSVRWHGLIDAVAAILCLCTVTGFLGKYWWIFDLTSHFRMQYFVGLAIAALCYRARRHPVATGVYLVSAAINLAVIWPMLLPKRDAPDRTDPQIVIRALLANVRSSNPNFDRVRSLIREQRPDLFVLIEVNDAWVENLSSLTNVYPHRHLAPREDNFGIALFSQHPIARSETLHLGSASVPTIRADVSLGNSSLTVIGTHPVPPVSGRRFQQRNEQLELVATEVRQQTNDVIVLADLNTTPWNHFYRSFLKSSGLAVPSDGLHPSWPSFFLPMRIPIDHCLVSENLTVMEKSLGRSIGSDHLPLNVRLGFPKKLSQERD